MTVDDLNTMPIDDLAAVIDRAKTTHKRRLAERWAALKTEFEAKLKSEGFTLGELLDESGKPTWLQEVLGNGADLRNLRAH